MKKLIVIFQLLMLVMVLPVQAQNQKKDFRKDFEAFKKKAKQEYADFRKQAFAEYTKFVREAWEEFGAEPPVQIPEEEKVEPMVAPGFEEETAGFFSKLFGGGKKDKKEKEKKEKEKEKKKMAKREKTNDQFAVSTVIDAPAPAPKQPQPISKVTQTSDPNPYMSFDVFGTQCRVRMGDNCRFHLSGLSGDEIADKLIEFQKPQFDNMLYDCLEERKARNFSDWAYYQMLLALTNKFYGNHTNEATLALGFLYSQSGYKMRYAHDGKTLYMIVASQYNMFGKSYFYVDGEWYYLLDNIKDGEKLNICKAKFPKESPLSLQMSARQNFANAPVNERTITSLRNPDFSFTVKSNKNSIDFYNTYPCSYTGDNFMTRWANYANTPLEKWLTDQIYPGMREKLKGLTPLEAVQQLDWWVQGKTDLKRENPDQECFLYAYDESVWGYDRNFFGEESIFYPFNDCEDRSILLSHLVRDLVGLDVILVYYPGHLAMAVNFPNDVPGDYVAVNGRKFTICDPTYIGSDVGETMPTMKGKATKVILLKRIN